MELITVIFILIINLKFHYFAYCPYSPQCVCTAKDAIECYNFQSFTELNFPTDSSLKVSNLKISSKLAQLRLNNDLNASNLNLDFYNFELRLENLDGIELNENPFFNKTTDNTQLLYLHISNSTFEFYFRNNSFDWVCDLVINDQHINPIFASFKQIFLGYFYQINYTRDICPVVFKNAKIDWLYLSAMTPDNRMKFIQLNSTQINLNSRVKYLQIQSSNIDLLDTSLLDKNVFKYLEKLSIEFSNLNRIDENLFKCFKYLKRVNLWLYNLNELLQTDTKWIQFLNYNKTDEQLVIEFNDETNSYEYSEEDFCLFKKFPHERLVFPILNSRNSLNCSCTIMWLISNWNKSEKNIITGSVSSCLKNFELRVQQCNFELKIKKCNVDYSLQIANFAIFNYKITILINLLYFAIIFQVINV